MSQVRNKVVWSEEEQKQLEVVKNQTHTAKIREEKRLLFNREAKEKGYHVFEPFRGKKPKLRCMLCNTNVDLAQYDAGTGEIKGINWARATHNICPQNEKGKQAWQDRKVETRNKHLREWNLKHRGDATHHVYYQVTEKTFQYLACQRPQCGLHIKPAAWPHQMYRWAEKHLNRQTPSAAAS